MINGSCVWARHVRVCQVVFKAAHRGTEDARKGAVEERQRAREAEHRRTVQVR